MHVPQETLLEHMEWSPPKWQKAFTASAPATPLPVITQKAQAGRPAYWRWVDNYCRACGAERNAQHVGCKDRLVAAIGRLNLSAVCVICNKPTLDGETSACKLQDLPPIHPECLPAWTATLQPAALLEALALCR